MDSDYKGKDKLYHFGVCFVIAFYSTESALAAAFAKEYGDWKGYGHFCLWDILADCLGAALGTIVRFSIIDRWNWL